jgi:DNA-binding protein HU-beta
MERAGAFRFGRLEPLQRRGESSVPVWDVGAVTKKGGSDGLGWGVPRHYAANTGDHMSKAFLAQVIQDSAELTGAAAQRTAGALMVAIVKELKKSGKFTLPSFGTFVVRKTRARKGLNPRTGESIKVKAGKTVRFKASPTLKKAV